MPVRFPNPHDCVVLPLTHPLVVPSPCMMASAEFATPLPPVHEKTEQHPDFFISYHWSSRRTAKGLEERLGGLGYVLAGLGKLSLEVGKDMASVRAVIPLLSKDYEQSASCRKELQRAKKTNVSKSYCVHVVNKLRVVGPY